MDVGGGQTRTWLEDGDQVSLRGWVHSASTGEKLFGFGDCKGVVTAFPKPEPKRSSIKTVDATTFAYIVEQNVDIPLSTSEKGVIRANIYRPHESDQGVKFPVLVTYGPYGKDVFYGDFRQDSFSEVNPEHKSEHSAWETPDPKWWTGQGYIVLRADERGIGQSPGLLDTMSRGTSEAFFDVIEWASQQPWSSGKVGLLGISYYAGTQWRVAARKPKGLAAIIPWEGMSDYYRDRCRHGGILADRFICKYPNQIRGRRLTAACSLLVESTGYRKPIWQTSSAWIPRNAYN